MHVGGESILDHTKRMEDGKNQKLKYQFRELILELTMPFTLQREGIPMWKPHVVKTSSFLLWARL